MATTLTLELSDRMVLRVFGKYPERGRMLPSGYVGSIDQNLSGVKIPADPELVRTAGVMTKTKGLMTNDGRFVPKGDPNLGPWHEGSRYKVVPVQVLVRPVVVLHCVRRGLWRVTVGEEYANAAKRWLLAVCREPKRNERQRKPYKHDRRYTPPSGWIKHDRGYRHKTGI